jgi:hypothetical protein
MYRFIVRGESDCSNCKYYGESDLCPRMRCRHPDNIRKSYVGMIYERSPDHINRNNFCEWYIKEK